MTLHNLFISGGTRIQRMIGALHRANGDLNLTKGLAALSLLAILAFFLLHPALCAAQEPFVITGRVSEATGVPLPRANVSIIGYAVGAVADDGGVYRIVIPSAQIREDRITVQASMVGYRSRTATVGTGTGRVTLDFSLSIDVLQLEEMVVTGLGTTVSRDRLGVTIARVPGAAVSNSDATSLIASLSARAANVNITSTNGDPGAGAYIRIRGAGSLTGGTQPLFVVDGTPINNDTHNSIIPAIDAGAVTQQSRSNDINPEDIESVDILKGAAASAIFGSRAANGVVLITTRSGKAGRPRLTYKISYSWDQVNRTLPLQRTYGQGINGVSSQTTPLSWGPKLDGGAQTYDHAREIFRTGHVFENALTLSGGTPETTYYLSLARTRQTGVAKGNSAYTRNAFRFKGEQRLGTRFSLAANFSFVDIPADRVQAGSNISGIILGGWRTPPDFNNLPYLTEEGFHRAYQVQNPTQRTGTRVFNNPFFSLNELVNRSDVSRIFGNVRLEYEPIDRVNVRYTLGYDNAVDNRRTVYPIGDSSHPLGRVIREELSNKEIDGSLLISTVGRFGDQVTLNAVLGQNLNHREFRNFSTTGDGLSVNGLNQLGNAPTHTGEEFESVIHTVSHFAQVSAGLYRQFYLTGALRNDGSSTFGSSQKYHWYPKLSGAWEFTRFRGPSHPGWLTYGKVRLAYGEAGQQPDVYSTLDTYVSDTFDEILEPGPGSTAFGFGGFFSADEKGQPEIKPQRTRETEFGLELGLMDNRLGLDLAMYSARTTDAIFFATLPPSTGYKNQARNAGVLTRKGLEMGLQIRALNRPGIRWDLQAQYGRNRNKVVSLPGAEVIRFGWLNVSAALEGYPLGVFYGSFNFIRFGRGIKVEGVDIDSAYPQARPGDLYIAENGYPINDPEARVAGDHNPDWTGSVRNTVTLFDNLELSSLIDIRNGGVAFNGTRGALYHFGTHKDTEDRETLHIFEGRGPGSGKSVLRDQTWYTGLGSGFGGVASQFLEDAGYVKLREVSVAYTFRGPAVRRIGLDSVILRLSGRNLVTWTGFTGLDPDTNLTGPTTQRGLDWFSTPQTRSFVLTLRLNH